MTVLEGCRPWKSAWFGFGRVDGIYVGPESTPTAINKTLQGDSAGIAKHPKPTMSSD